MYNLIVFYWYRHIISGWEWAHHPQVLSRQGCCNVCTSFWYVLSLPQVMWRWFCALLVFTSQINEKWLNNCYLFLLDLSVKRKDYVLDKPSNSTQSYLGLSVKRKGCVVDKPSNSTQSYLVLSVKRKGCVVDRPNNSSLSNLGLPFSLPSFVNVSPYIFHNYATPSTLHISIKTIS